jgi:hypothetical protein
MTLSIVLPLAVFAWHCHAAHQGRKLINGGSVVDQATMNANYPWFASMVILDASYPCAPSCGGAMITKGTFLSAAHCLADQQTGEPATDTNNVVLVVGFAGSYDETQNGFPQSCTQSALQRWVTSQYANAQVLAISGFKKPIHYNKRNGYDIMLAFAKSSDCPTGNASAIKVNGQCGGFDETIGSSNMMTLLGFGATVGERGIPSPVLKKLDDKIDSVGTSDSSCNLNVPVGERFPSVVCADETPGTPQCADTDGNPTPNAAGCTPGVKGASGDSGGPWITRDATNGERTHVFVQSSGYQNNAGQWYGYLMRDAWFQDWIFEIMKTNDNCGGDQLTAQDIFVGYASSANQYCQGQGCIACTDSTVSDANCLTDVNCAIAPTVNGCVTIPTQAPLAGPSCGSTSTSAPGATSTSVSSAADNTSAAGTAGIGRLGHSFFYSVTILVILCLP